MDIADYLQVEDEIDYSSSIAHTLLYPVHYIWIILLDISLIAVARADDLSLASASTMQTHTAVDCP
jgi:hypothetical protein